MNALDFDTMIHAERGELLKKLPKGAKVFCSAGCSGKWYFDWIEEMYGPVDLHYGVELYSAQPDELPANVHWIPNSVSDMHDVSTETVDLLFSGQNVEHLYRDDLVGFFLEANRVLKSGGILCIDSPNRKITAPLGYVHPQHVLEFTEDEMAAVVEKAGFEIDAVKGIWDCSDVLRHNGDVTSLTGDVAKRRVLAEKRPEQSFIWWIVARKVRPAAKDFDNYVGRLLARQFPAFTARRFGSMIGRIVDVEGSSAIVAVDHKDFGYAIYGPYVPLRPGSFVASFDIRFNDTQGGMLLDVASAGGAIVHTSTQLSPSNVGKWQHISLPFELMVYSEGVETRLETRGANATIRVGATILRS